MVKDLIDVCNGRDLKDIIIVDDNFRCYHRDPRNAVPIPAYTFSISKKGKRKTRCAGSACEKGNCTCLNHCAKLLAYLVKKDDVRIPESDEEKELTSLSELLPTGSFKETITAHLAGNRIKKRGKRKQYDPHSTGGPFENADAIQKARANVKNAFQARAASSITCTQCDGKGTESCCFWCCGTTICEVCKGNKRISRWGT